MDIIGFCNVRSLSLFVGADGEVDAFEGEWFFMQDWQFSNACEFPCGNVGVFFVVTLGFTVVKLVFQSEVGTTGFFACQCIVAKEFAELGVAG